MHGEAGPQAGFGLIGSRLSRRYSIHADAGSTAQIHGRNAAGKNAAGAIARLLRLSWADAPLPCA
ncbi:MAG: hypothetical protein KatS3mg052_1240 [Candidatus Roseilinea sp.]|nr:MAG: hypothetical protein KatS3mg052_1240 [Candidatus Roseilinea sp.]